MSSTRTLACEQQREFCVSNHVSRLTLLPGSYPSGGERWSRLLAIVQRDSAAPFLPLLGVSLEDGMHMRRIAKELPPINAGDLGSHSTKGASLEELGAHFRDEISRQLGTDLTVKLTDLVSKGMPDFPDMQSAGLWDSIFPIIDKQPERLPSNLNVDPIRSAVRSYLDQRMPPFLGTEELLPIEGRTPEDPRYDDYVALSNLEKIYQWQLHRDFWRKIRTTMSEADIQSLVEWAGTQGDWYASTLGEPPD